MQFNEHLYDIQYAFSCYGASQSVGHKWTFSVEWFRTMACWKMCNFFGATLYKQKWLQFFLIVKATTLKQQISKFHLQILNTEGSTTSITVNGLSNVKAFTTRRNCSYFCLYTVYKNDTNLACHNSHVHQPILISFSRCIPERANYQIVMYFPPQLTNVFTLPGET